MKKILILLAGGQGARMFSPVNKVLLNICGKTVIHRSAKAFSGFVDEFIVVCRPEEKDRIMEQVSPVAGSIPVQYVHGGSTRQASVINGLQAFSGNPDDIILIHDAARCLVEKDVISRVLHSCLDCGSGVPAVSVTSTYKICDSRGYVLQTPERDHLFEIQTPQGFKAEYILHAAITAREDGYEGTDDACLLEHCGLPVRIVEGSVNNIKLTSPADMEKAAIILKGNGSDMRIGMGYDVHQLVEGRRLILCGEVIPSDLGLLGHSDADVAVHALMDAMLGACSLGDIGRHFPDTDDRYKGISSILLLKETVKLLQQRYAAVYNADITIVAQRPKLSKYIPRMIHNLSEILEIPEDRINIKATTTEKLGFEGRMEGISAYAVCTVKNLYSETNDTAIP